jgi:hypothetical protein
VAAVPSGLGLTPLRRKTREELLEAVFLCGPCRGYITRTSCHYDSLEMAVRRVGGWCEMGASLRGREPGDTGTSTVGRRYQAAQ